MENIIDKFLVGIGITVVVFLMSCWPYNLYKFIKCDFEPNYKCEAMHGIGIFIPPASIFTVFFETDE